MHPLPENPNSFKSPSPNDSISFLLSSLSLPKEETFEHILLLLCVLCGFLSKEEMVWFTSRSYVYIEKCFRSLVKKGYLEPVLPNPPQKRILAKTGRLYTFTKNGYQLITQLFGQENILNAYQKKAASPLNVHDYLCGRTFLSCIQGLYGEPFSYLREHVYGLHRRGIKTLAVDAELFFPAFTLHIEQDTGSESNAYLLSKLFLYQKYPLAAPIFPSKDHAILISYARPVLSSSPAFYRRRVHTLTKMLEKQQDETLLKDAFFATFLPKELEETLTAILEKESLEKPFTVSDLRKMDTRYAQENPLYQKAYQDRQYQFFLEKRKALHFALFSTPEYALIRQGFLKGGTVFLAPTYQVEGYIRYICLFPSYFENFSECLASYFGTLSTLRHETWRDLGNGLTLLHHIPSECGELYFEYPTIDLSAPFRIREFVQISATLSGSHHIIVIVDNEKEALYLAKWTKDFYRRGEQALLPGGDVLTALFVNPTRNDVYYLTKADLEQKRTERLFFASGYREYPNNDGVIAIGENRIFRLISEKNPALAGRI